MGNFDDLKSIDLKNSGLKTTLPRLKILNLFSKAACGIYRLKMFTRN